MKKATLILCFALLLSACSAPAELTDINWEAYNKSHQEETVIPTNGGVIESNKPIVTTTAPAETAPPAETVPKLTDEEINALDNTMHGYGQGVQVDENNRPLGAIDFNNEYGEHDAYAMLDSEKEIFLTFDQGYENGYTEKILDTLKEKNVHATFFLTGDYVRSVDPALIQRMIDEGHVLGNHGDKHKSLPEELLPISIERAEQELLDCHNLVKEKFGYEMKYSRPPKGEFSERSLEVTKRLGYKTFLWSFAYKDWIVDQQPDKTEAYNKITKFAHGGEIMLLHSVSSTNTEILGDLIDGLQAEGYTFSTPSV